jgi:DUF971 family protein
LHELGRDHAKRFARYLDELETKGLSRDTGAAAKKHVH